MLNLKVLVLFVFFAASSALRGDIVIDKAKKEVRLPFVFIQSTQLIEVFGCSPGGPTHETIIVFQAKGNKIAEALVEIGARPKNFWQVTNKQDFMHTQGDRILVLLSWEYNGEKQEVAAENLLWRTGEDLPEPVHGFSFVGEKIKYGNPPKVKVPDCVEITMGGTGRQSSVSSILIHPTALEFLMYYESGIEINSEYKREISALAEKGAGGTMTLRLVTESELVKFREKQEKPLHWGFESVYKEEEPVAAEIDKLKQDFVNARNKINGLIASNDPGNRKKVEIQLSEAAFLSWKIQQKYVDIYRPEWEFQHQILKDRLKSFETHWDLGYNFLINYLPERVNLARLQLEKTKHDKTGDIDLRIQLSRAKLFEAQSLKNLPLYLREIEDLKERINTEKKHKSTFLLEMLENDLEKKHIQCQKAKLEAGLQQFYQKDIELKLQGKSDKNGTIAGKIKDLKKNLSELDIKKEITEINDELRWKKEDVMSKNPRIKTKAQKELEKLKARKKELMGRAKINSHFGGQP